MIEIEFKENLEDDFYKLIDDEFNKFALKNDVVCNYVPFNFIAKDAEKVIGIITGHSYYQEVHISDLIVLEQYRHKHIGKKLVEAVEHYYQGKGFENINLTTYQFQAPEFYKKCGFEVEFFRENKKEPKLGKYLLIKRR